MPTIPALPVAAALAAADPFPVSQSGAAKRSTIAAIATYIDSTSPHTSVARTASANASSTSATYVNFGASVAVTSFVKNRADTKIIAVYMGGLYNDNGLGQYEVGVQINGTDYSLSAAFSTLRLPGQREITGIPAGTYTCTLRKRVGNGTGAVFDGDTGTLNSLSITETL